MLDYVSTGGGAFMEFLKKMKSTGNRGAESEFVHEGNYQGYQNCFYTWTRNRFSSENRTVNSAGVDVVRLNFSLALLRNIFKELRGCMRQHTDLKEMWVLWLIFKDQKYGLEI